MIPRVLGLQSMRKTIQVPNATVLLFSSPLGPPHLAPRAPSCVHVLISLVHNCKEEKHLNVRGRHTLKLPQSQIKNFLIRLPSNSHTTKINSRVSAPSYACCERNLTLSRHQKWPSLTATTSSLPASSSSSPCGPSESSLAGTTPAANMFAR